ncbi:MAG: histidine kinase [Kiritimatiellia bacterium]
MKKNIEKAKWSRRYQSALRNYLEQGPGASLRPAVSLGGKMAALGFETLDLAGFHERALMALSSQSVSSGARNRMVKRAGLFFAEAVVPIEKNHRAALKSDIRLKQLARALRRRMAASFDSARCLERNILMRRGAEQALKKSGKQHGRIMAELLCLQKQLRDLTRTSLLSQEDERQSASSQLHDDIAQALIAIDLRLLILKRSARSSTANLRKEIDKTQQLVAKSVKRINLFAHEFFIQHKA